MFSIHSDKTPIENIQVSNAAFEFTSVVKIEYPCLRSEF